ncbi:MAG: hypothetical protein F9K32_19050 [Desulfobulbaceae bacterium]|nr:MAG: hypothetical protein F9K32_19050 [Desulfobulbaceae bacterium]
MKLFGFDIGLPHEARPQPGSIDDCLRPLGGVEEIGIWQATGCSRKRRLCLAVGMPPGNSWR